MTRRLVAFAALLLAPLAGLRAADVPSRPNILYIMADDHAAHAISAYSGRINKTPHLDRLAQRGHAAGRLLLRQLDLHAQPGLHPDGQVQPQERRAGVQPLRRLAADRWPSTCRRPATTRA